MQPVLVRRNRNLLTPCYILYTCYSLPFSIFPCVSRNKLHKLCLRSVWTCHVREGRVIQAARLPPCLSSISPSHHMFARQLTNHNALFPSKNFFADWWPCNCMRDLYTWKKFVPPFIKRISFAWNTLLFYPVPQDKYYNSIFNHGLAKIICCFFSCSLASC